MNRLEHMKYIKFNTNFLTIVLARDEGYARKIFEHFYSHRNYTQRYGLDKFILLISVPFHLHPLYFRHV